MNPIIDAIRDRLYKKNQNFLCIVVGATGTGKSYVSLRLAEMIDPDFTIDNVAFKAREFVKILNSGKLKKGSVVVWDEVGTGMSNREWYSTTNKLTNLILQTFRNLNLCVFFTVPSQTFVDNQARKLMHGTVETQSINRSKKCAIVKFLMLEYNPRYDTIYYKYPRVRKDGHIVTIERLRVNIPSKELVKQYEAKREIFTSELRKSVEESMDEDEAKKRVVDIQDIAKKVTARKEEFVKEYNGRKFVDKDLIQNEFDIGGRNALKVQKSVEKELKL